MRNIKGFIAFAAFALLVVGLPAIASAQWRDRDDDYNRNGGYGNNGGYYNQNLQYAVQQLKQQTRNFERQTDDNNGGYNNGGYGNGGYGNGGYGNNRGERIEDLADDLAKAASRLENKFGRGRNLNNSRDEAQRVVQIASQIASTMGRGRNNGYNGGEWYAIDNSVRTIAQGYGLSYNPRGNRNNRGNGRGNNRNTGGNLPSWWPF